MRFAHTAKRKWRLSSASNLCLNKKVRFKRKFYIDNYGQAVVQ